jgi:hypothetical protein
LIEKPHTPPPLSLIYDTGLKLSDHARVPIEYQFKTTKRHRSPTCEGER